MIITITLNPAIDHTVEIKHFEIEALNRVVKSRRDPGGKGINVSKVIHALGGVSVATGFLAGEAGDHIEKSMLQLGIECNFLQVEGETRTNIKVFDQETGEITELNEAGPEIRPKDLLHLKKKLDHLVSPGAYIVLSGSAPKNMGTQIYGDLIHYAKQMGAIIFLDADGILLKEGIKAGPHIIKPNRKELESYVGYALKTDLEVLSAARSLLQYGVEKVFVTLGVEGALYVSETETFRMMPLEVLPNSSVGAGDAFVGACVYALEKNMPTDDMLKLCIAASAGAVETEGTNPPSRNWVMNALSQVTIKQINETE